MATAPSTPHDSVVPRPGTRWNRPASVVIAATVAVTVGVLYWEGRRWWCACGSWDLWWSDPNSAHSSQHFVDPYSFTHVLHGVLLCGILAWLWPRLRQLSALCITVIAESLWEILENSPLVIDRYRTATIALGYEGDSIINSLGDILSCGLGFLLARRLGWKWSLAFVVATELILLIWIRDNLFLNVLMLAFPIEAIRTWQGGL